MISNKTSPRSRRAVASLLVFLFLLQLLVPLTAASHQQVKLLPHETGLGSSDVRSEPNEFHDDNGFPHNDFRPQAATLILDSYYETNVGPLDTDLNSPVNFITYGDAHYRYEDRIYPGLGFFGAWWGWWTDLGSGGQFKEHGLGSSIPDGSINDGHDNHAAYESTAATGPWDEFVWRGENPWAIQHTGCEPDGTCRSYPDDSLLLFISPGTHRTVVNQPPDPTYDESGYLLRNDLDDQRLPDMRMTDRTGYGPYDPEPAPQRGGWVAENGFMFFTADQSLLITTTVVTSANPDPSGRGTYDPYEATAVDMDVYTTLHPGLEQLYRMAVWDPGNQEESPADSLLGNEGAKQSIKGFFTHYWLYQGDAVTDALSETMKPTRPSHGVVDDAAGSKPSTHEPNTPEDDFNGHATHDPSTRYGGLDTYYVPGPNQTYIGYQGGARPWLDMQAGYGVWAPLVATGAAATLQLRGPSATINTWDSEPIEAYFPVKGFTATDQTHHTSSYPGLLYFTGNFGSWYDENGDTFIGDLDEPGRYTSSEEPYARGTVSDPNDYADHAVRHASDPAKQVGGGVPEWRGYCGEGSHVEVALDPLTNDGRWGESGVYIVMDDDGSMNPYDDVLGDWLGAGPWGHRPDGQRYVSEGTIVLGVACDKSVPGEGFWRARGMILLPTGTLELPIMATTTAETGGGHQVKDVDFLSALVTVS